MHGSRDIADDGANTAAGHYWSANAEVGMLRMQRVTGWASNVFTGTPTMVIPVLVEQISGDHFRAVTGEPLSLEVEATTRDEALEKLRQLIDSRMAAGAEIIEIPVRAKASPLAPFAGLLRDDPLVEPWKQAMAEYRSQRDGDV